MLQVESLPWFQFAAFLDAAGQFTSEGSHFPYVSRETPSQSWQPVTSNKLNVESLDNSATRVRNQELVVDSTIRSNPNRLQDNRLDMINLTPYAHGGKFTTPVLSKMLCLLPENSQANLELNTRSSAMQLLKLLMFLLSNNHVNHVHQHTIDVDEIILSLVRGRACLQYKHLLSHNGITSEALSEKIFQSALRAKDVQVIQTMLDFGIDPMKQGHIQGYTPLQYVSLSNNVEIATRLIEAGAGVNATSSYRTNSPLTLAAYSEQLEVIALLLTEGAHANTAGGVAALRVAVQKGDILLAQNLISAGVDITTEDDRGYTALHYAHKSLEMVKVLLQAGADIDAVTHHDFTVLEFAAQHGSLDIVRSLLDAEPQAFGSAVYFAAEHGDIELIRMLLDAGADVDGCFCGGRRTALTRAAENENVRLVRFLLDAGANADGCTLEHDADQHVPDYDAYWEVSDHDDRWQNYTPLQVASFHKEIEIASILIEAGADINADFATGNLRELDSYADVELDDAGDADDVDIAQYQFFHGTAIQIAAHQGNMELVWLFWEAGAKVNAPAYQHGGRTALQAAIERGHYLVVGFLLAAGADVNAHAAMQDGRSALAAAIMLQDVDLSNRLMKAGANLEDPSARHSGVTALAAATANGDVELVRYLLLAGANPNDSAALFGAVENDDVELVRILLASRADIHNYEDESYGHMALCVATTREHDDLVEMLLASKVDPHFCTSDGLMCYLPLRRRWIYSYDELEERRSPWLCAIETGNLQLVRTFLEGGARPNGISGADYGTPALARATFKSDLPLMQILLEAGADVDQRKTAPFESAFTSLCLAAEVGNTDGVHLLLKAGANVNSPAAARFGRTPLQVAAQYGKEDIVDILLEAGADVNAPPASYGGVTALQAAAIGGFLRIARVLLEAGADPDAAAAEEEGRTSLAGAAEHGRIDMLQFLLDNGADINGPGQAQYESAIRLAAESGHQAACNLLKSRRRRMYGSP